MQVATCRLHGNIPVGIKVKGLNRPPLNRRRTGRHHEGAARRRFQVGPVQHRRGEVRRKRHHAANRQPLPVATGGRLQLAPATPRPTRPRERRPRTGSEPACGASAIPRDGQECNVADLTRRARTLGRCHKTAGTLPRTSMRSKTPCAATSPPPSSSKFRSAGGTSETWSASPTDSLWFLPSVTADSGLIYGFMLTRTACGSICSRNSLILRKFSR